MAVRIISKLGTNVPCVALTKCCYFKANPNSNIATLASDCLTHFQLLLKNDPLQTWHKCSLWGPTNCCYFKVDPESNMATLASDQLSHFLLLLKKLQGSTPNLAQMFLVEPRPSVISD